MKYLMVAGGELKSPEILKNKLQKYDKVIAVDSGYNHCMELGLEPDVIIGDLDSIGDTSTQLNCVVLTASPEKDDTDLKLALEFAIKRGATEITFACATGGRLDHMLNNLSILNIACDAGIQCELVDEYNRITILQGKRTYPNISKYVSLIPITDVIVVSSSHLKYPMNRMEIYRYNIISVSNEAIADDFTLNVIDGKAFVVQSD